MWLDIIEYRDFSDVPRMMVLEHDRKFYLFDSPFDAALDDYCPEYTAYELPPELLKALPRDGTELSALAIRHVGEVAVEDVEFDESRRKRIRLRGIGKLLHHNPDDPAKS
jgi:hypothetical protein